MTGHQLVYIFLSLAFMVTFTIQKVQVISARQRIEELEKQNAALQESKLARDKADYDAKVAAIFK